MSIDPFEFNLIIEKSRLDPEFVSDPINIFPSVAVTTFITSEWLKLLSTTLPP